MIFSIIYDYFLFISQVQYQLNNFVLRKIMSFPHHVHAHTIGMGKNHNTEYKF